MFTGLIQNYNSFTIRVNIFLLGCCYSTRLSAAAIVPAVDPLHDLFAAHQVFQPISELDTVHDQIVELASVRDDAMAGARLDVAVQVGAAVRVRRVDDGPHVAGPAGRGDQLAVGEDEPDLNRVSARDRRRCKQTRAICQRSAANEFERVFI